MQWPVLVGKKRVQPSEGTWHHWKQRIADDCDGRCIYCAISEARFGGIRNFHVEHFRPKIRFPKLENKIKNLYLACAICNVLKSDDWPCEPAPNHSLAAYPDPSGADFNGLFAVSPQTHQVDSATVAGRYLIERVVLNRAQLILERRLDAVIRFSSGFAAWVNQSMAEMTRAELKAAVKVLLTVASIQIGALTARPYPDAATKRPHNRRRRKTLAHKR